MNVTLSLVAIKEILAAAPVESTDKKIDATLVNFISHVLSINRPVVKSAKKKNEDDLNDDREPKIDNWKELKRFYFYNLIRKYSRGTVDPSEAKEILEDCIITKYISQENIKSKIEQFKDDEHLTKKFTSDLYYSVLSFGSRKKRTRTISLQKEDDDGKNKSFEVDVPEGNELLTIENIDYSESDLSEMLFKSILKPAEFSNYIIWNFKQLEDVKLNFKNNIIKIPFKFATSNNTVARYYFWAGGDR